MELQLIQIVKAILRKRRANWSIYLANKYQTYYEVAVIKTTWHWHKDRPMDQWNRMSRNKFSHILSIGYKLRCKGHLIRKTSIFNGAGET